MENKKPVYDSLSEEKKKELKEWYGDFMEWLENKEKEIKGAAK